jgi:hypothetical protein
MPAHASPPTTASVPAIVALCRIRVISKFRINPAASRRSADACSASAITPRNAATAANTASAHASRRTVFGQVVVNCDMVEAPTTDRASAAPDSISVHIFQFVKLAVFFFS